MSTFETGLNWNELSEKERKRRVEQAMREIAQNTGYPSRKEKAKKRHANGTLSGADSRDAKKSKGNRPGATRTKIKRGGVASLPKNRKA